MLLEDISDNVMSRAPCNHVEHLEHLRLLVFSNPKNQKKIKEKKGGEERLGSGC